ncbi:MAG: hypothetical protein K2H18_04020, partial [Muribaculaceae bacterium]|nr:hypothetical protein [Muribaculaceae bacterium]
MKLNKIYMMLGLALLLGSCKSEEPAEPVQTRSVEVPVSFTIQLASEAGGTRADGPDGTVWDDEEGKTNAGLKEFDNKINTVVPVLYEVVNGTMSATPVAKMTVQDKKEQGAGNSNVWVISGVMSCNPGTTEDDLLTKNYRLALFINCDKGDVKKPLDPENPGDAKFYHHGIPGQNLDGEALSEPFESIPMYGVTQINFEKDGAFIKATGTGTNGKITVNVLRSMAKVRVLLSAALQGKVKLTNLSISRHAIQGYVCPKKWNTAADFADVASSAYMRGMTGSSSFYNHVCNTDISTIHHEGTGGNSENKIGFYLPDTYNSHHDGVTGSDEIKLIISYDIYSKVDGVDTKVAHHDNPMWFRPVSEWSEEKRKAKEPWDIIRNHIYEFVITGVEPTTGALIVDVAVKPWVKHEFTEWYEKIPDPTPAN